MPRPTVIPGYRSSSARCALIECPKCSTRAWIDKEQYVGKATIECPDCDYREKHDLTTELIPESRG